MLNRQEVVGHYILLELKINLPHLYVHGIQPLHSGLSQVVSVICDHQYWSLW